MKLIIQIVLLVGILIMGYLVYDSIDSRMDFEKESIHRKDVVVERLKDIRAAQIAYKDAKGEYTKNFDALLNFIKNEKITVIRQVGSMEDSVAVAEGRVIRDTTYINVIDTVFSDSYLQGRIRGFYPDSLPFIPYGEGEKFQMDAGETQRNQVRVKVFYVFAPNSAIYNGLDADRYNVKMNEGLSVGSMSEPITSGNWE